MKNLLIEIASHALGITALAVFSPYLVYAYFREAYEEEEANARMHRSIDTFLRDQRDSRKSRMNEHNPKTS